MVYKLPIVVFVQDASKEFDLCKVLVVNILKNEVMSLKAIASSKDYKLADKAFKVCYEMLFASKEELFKERSPIRYIEGLETSIRINSLTKRLWLLTKTSHEICLIG